MERAVVSVKGLKIIVDYTVICPFRKQVDIVSVTSIDSSGINFAELLSPQLKMAIIVEIRKLNKN